MASQAEIGLIGLGVMGQNLALNIADHGFEIAVYNRTGARTEAFAASDEASARPIVPSANLEGLIGALRAPRAIILMVKAGAATDEQIAALAPLLEPGDVIVDGGNARYQDTVRRERALRERGLRFLGAGISGGEEGARFGPSIMAGGEAEAYARLQPVLEAIAAKVDGTPCCAHLGPDGAGHFVKMVHNGIEYGDMQLICEAYFLLREALALSNDQLYDVFADWNRGELDSYLIEITRDIFSVKDELTGQYLVDMILDKAGAKGTGKWMSQLALDLGVPSTLVTEAVYARCLSALKEARVRASQVLSGPPVRFEGDKTTFIEEVRQALYASKIASYAQGFVQLQAAAKEHDWPLDYGNIALLWRGGCIIRARFLDRIKEAFDAKGQLETLLLAP
ncbi:MAG: NADP-dependent phosphogluconate dehydrogenase, partial [Geminicoccaceae bacterium]